MTPPAAAHARLLAAAPDLLTLIEQAVADRIDDVWLRNARAVLDGIHEGD